MQAPKDETFNAFLRRYNAITKKTIKLLLKIVTFLE